MNIISVFDLLLITVLFFRPALSEILEDPSLLEILAYDYVVVGGAWSKPRELDLIDAHNSRVAGTAGLTLASRLTENPNVTVLVLEAGVR